MFPRFAFSLIFGLCAFGLGMAVPAFPQRTECGPNAEYMTCGSACVPDCSNPEPPKFCTLQCVMGCFCKAGYLKNANGECVLPENCMAQTEGHLIGGFRPLPPHVEEQGESIHLIGGIRRHPHGQQQSEGQLIGGFRPMPPMQQCPDNEMFQPCGSACAPTCANPHPSPVCTRQCIIGCFCKPGYLRNKYHVCVPADKCDVPEMVAMFAYPPEVCADENEEFRQCKGCDGTCETPVPPCPRVCKPGCACKEGHVRSGPNGKCIKLEQCPAPTMAAMLLPPCGPNMVFRTCGTACPATCANPNPSPVCTKNCVIGCFCKEGYLKNANGACVPAANCNADTTTMHPYGNDMIMPNTGRPYGNDILCPTDSETYVEDDAGKQLDCMATCGTPFPWLIMGHPQIPAKCKNVERGPSCVCKHPYVRNEHGKCVTRSECPQTTTTPSQ